MYCLRMLGAYLLRKIEALPSEDDWAHCLGKIRYHRLRKIFAHHLRNIGAPTA